MNKCCYSVRSLDLYYIIFYMLIIHVSYMAVTLMGGDRMPVYLIIDIVALYSIVMAIKYLRTQGADKLSMLDICVLFYIIISILSVVLYCQRNNPASIMAFAYGIHLLIIPMFLYFAIKLMNIAEQNIFLKRICILNVLFMLYGLIVYCYQPEYFTNYLKDNLFAEQGIQESWILYSRLQSYFGSSAIGTLSWVTMILLIILNVGKYVELILFTVLIGSSLLSQQRGGIFGIVVALLYYVVSRKGVVIKNIVTVCSTIFMVMLVVSIISYKYKNDLPYDLMEYIKVRVMNEAIFGNPFEERQVSRDKGWKVMSEFPLGLGVGASTSGADSSGANPGGQIVDANYHRISADLGLIGLFSFLSVVWFSIKSAMKNCNKFAWIIIVVMYCVQGLGTNVFDNFYVSHIYWILLGVIDSDCRKYYTKSQHVYN